MTGVYGFELIQDQKVQELNTRGRLYRHVKTGAQLLSLENSDANKVFAITFRTPPEDSTGVAHIMEHSVLCGSQKYPIKEPFVELMKGSLNTFLNAFTFPDKTCYPVASQNLQDFYNLIDVYMDAVLYPLISPQTLQQEGWHYELDNPDAPLSYKGVVFNEMKGAYSSPDSLMYKYVQQTLFPDHVYGVDSGGDPRCIPDLTYGQFKAFHERFYHPSNALIYFYGDDEPDARLRLMDQYLNSFDAIQPGSQIGMQPRLEQPRSFVFGYDSGEGDDAKANKAMLTVNFLLADSHDTETSLGLFILAEILVGTPASPLRKALIDSGLGEDLAGAGLEVDLQQQFFSTGLKGIRENNAERVEKLVLETLQVLSEKGIDPETVAAALNTVEFRLRENNSGNFPQGLVVMLRALTTWLYDDDPLKLLAFDAPLKTIKERLFVGEHYFEGLVRSYFMENPHRTTILLKPEAGLQQKQDEEERQRLEKQRAEMDTAALERVMAETQALKRLQETPDSPENLAKIPALALKDLEKQNRKIPLEASESDKHTILFHDLFTNGIIYLDLGFDLRALTQELLPYVRLFGRSLLETGTQQEDFVRLSQHIGRATGGIVPTTFTTTVTQQDQATSWLVLRGKATVSQAGELFDILADVLHTARLDNQERFRQIVLEEKAEQEAQLVPMGHSVVNRRLHSLFTDAGWAAEQMGGLSYLFFLRKLIDKIDKSWPEVLGKLEMVRRVLVNRQSMISNVTLDQENWRSVKPVFEKFIAKLPEAVVSRPVWERVRGSGFEGLTIPAKVNYVGKGARLYELGYELNGSVIVITNFLRATWLWERVRVHGGAYGGFCTFDLRSGVFNFLSYRDPNLIETVKNYDSAAQFLRELDDERLNPQELTKSIIGAIGDLDLYQLPDAKGLTSMQRYLAGDSEEALQMLRDQVLSTNLADFHAFGEILERVNEAGQVVVLGSQEAIQAANAQQSSQPSLEAAMGLDSGDWLQVHKVL